MSWSYLHSTQTSTWLNYPFPRINFKFALNLLGRGQWPVYLRRFDSKTRIQGDGHTGGKCPQRCWRSHRWLMPAALLAVFLVSSYVSLIYLFLLFSRHNYLILSRFAHLLNLIVYSFIRSFISQLDQNFFFPVTSPFYFDFQNMYSVYV